jgi:hypothetical protein
MVGFRPCCFAEEIRNDCRKGPKNSMPTSGDSPAGLHFGGFHHGRGVISGNTVNHDRRYQEDCTPAIGI